MLRQVNKRVLEAEYAVRGLLLQRATEIEAELRQGKQWPFERVVKCNIGNPQAFGSHPPQFAREVLSVLMNPTITDRVGYSAEVRERAAEYGKLGAYTESKGLDVVRQQVAEFIERRDGYACDADDVYLTDGASSGVKRVLTLLAGGSILAPYPSYPLYAATATLCGGKISPYYLDEDQDWSLGKKELHDAYQAALERGETPRALVVINPGNPTGAVLGRDSLEAVVDFCRDKSMPLLADEVYQDNVYDGPAFVSLKKVVRDVGADNVPLFSFHSVSKGFTHECGLRGGYLEVTNLEPAVSDQLTKLASISLCSNVPGQVSTGLMVNPPESAPERLRYDKKLVDKFESLKRRSLLVKNALNKIEGVSCAGGNAALYCFPMIHLPHRAVDAARQAGLAPDAFYCMRLLEATGLVVVPGSGFGQKAGTYHARFTILPPEDQINDVLDRFAAFHDQFRRDFADDLHVAAA